MIAKEKQRPKPAAMKTESIVSTSMFLISGLAWVWGYRSGNGMAAVLAAGVVGGLLYDIAVSRGQYILPKQDSDGINLGSLYGAIVGFSVAIAVLQPLLPTPGATVYTSFDTFLIAAGVKTSSEFATSVRTELTKVTSSISFDARDLKTASQPKTVSGALLDRDGTPLKGKVVHISFKNTTSGMQASRDTVTTDFADSTNFTYQLPTLDKATWESWASWDGDDVNQGATSAHENFTI